MKLDKLCDLAILNVIVNYIVLMHNNVSNYDTLSELDSIYLYLI